MRVLISLLLLSGASLAMCQDAFLKAPSDTDQRFAKSYKEYVDAIGNVIDFSGAIGVYKSGSIEFMDFRGEESIGSGVMINEQSKFAIASLTKSFTAMLVLSLVEEEKIDLNKSIVDYLDYYPTEPGSQIKIDDLLNNRSGLPDYTARYNEVNNTTLDTKAFILEFCSGKPEFEPGSTYQYSNSGFYILGAIIEEVTGLSFQEALSNMIFKKANMPNSGLIQKGRLPSNLLVTGHENMEPTSPVNGYSTYAAGGIYSTISDMINWYKAMSSNSLLSKQTLDKQFSGKPWPYYQGWGYTPLWGKLGFSHTGGVKGFNSFMITIPSEDVYVVILANNSTLPLKKIGIDLAMLSMKAKVPLPEPKNDVSVPIPILNKMVGTYRHTGGNELIIERQEAKLVLQLFGSSLVLKANKINEFYFDEFGPVLSFDLYGKLTWKENGNSYEYNRVSKETKSSDVSEIIELKEGQALQGTYTSSENKSNIQILFKNGILSFQMNDGPLYQLNRKENWDFYYSVSENGYFFKYPVSFSQKNGEVSMIYDAEFNYIKKK